MKLMVFDGNSILNRAYYGIRPLTNREGLHTHAVYGFLTTLCRMADAEAPEALCVAFDVHAPTFRHKADASYKANRKPMPDDLREQVPVLKEALDALNIPRYELAGYEADDLLGTISRRCEASGWDCVIVTGDRDSLQLITEHTTVQLVSARMGRTLTEDMNPETFREKYGFPPANIVDLKALMGDASDNIPGVPGVGEKTAMTLIQRYQTVDAIYSKLPDIDAKPGVIKKLAAGEENARRSYWLATIKTDAPITFDPEANRRKDPAPDAYALFQRLEFQKLTERLNLKAFADAAPQPSEAVGGDCAAIELADMGAVLRARDALRGATVYVRTGGGLELAVLRGGGAAYALDAAAFQGAYDDALQTLFDGSLTLVGHGVKDVMRGLLERGASAEGWQDDTELMAYLLDATAGRYDLDRLARKYGGFTIARAPGDAPEGQQLSMLDAPAAPDAPPKSARCAALAAEAAAMERLRGIMASKLDELGLTELYRKAELPLCRVLAEMERTGCLVDRAALAAFGESLSGRIREQERKIYGLAGHEFNINSPKQLGEVLFDELKLPHGKKTKTGWSTNADALENLRDESELVAAVLEYRQYAKLKSTYADGLLKAIDPDGRVRTSFQMTATATGRLSSAEPNLQNIPTRTDLGSEIRKMFIPSPGNVFVDADYSQIELRLLAHISGDAAMQRAFLDGADIHAATAAQAFRVSPEEVTPEMRRHAKAVNFGIVYGISAFSLSKDIGVSVAEAKAYMDGYFAAFPGVRRYMDGVIERARERGYVETLFRRRRELPELSASKHALRAFGERVALNMPIQGTAADLMKLAMVAAWRRLKADCPAAKLVLQIHDELIAECPEADAAKVAAILREEMEGVAALSVPLTADAHWGRDWLQAKQGA
ncbi:MAG: DNA polymerase I [Oscillibacter sp.]|nr:DNA polymerase I [Oscillibacter sp.]